MNNLHIASVSKSYNNAEPTAFELCTTRATSTYLALYRRHHWGLWSVLPSGNAVADNAVTPHLDMFANTSLEQFPKEMAIISSSLLANDKSNSPTFNRI